MPRIILKHKSPEFADIETGTKPCVCDMPGCPGDAEYKAPKHRGLNEYYNFCFEHIREYNKAWDFFSGMSERDIQSHMEKSLYGDRPTWRYDSKGAFEDDVLNKVRSEFMDNEYENYSDSSRQNSANGPSINSTSPEHEALSIMGLSPPVTLDLIKTQYKKLAKKYHPDLNRDNPQAEELLKKVNMAYTILKLAFEEYKKLPEHKV